MRLLHEGFEGREKAAAEHAAGWERALRWLEAYARTVRDEEGARR